MARPKKPDNDPKPRRKRVPLGVHHSKMTVPSDLIPDTHVGRWINDDDNRINQAVAGGWDFVTRTNNSHVGGDHNDKNTDIGSRISQVVGTKKGGDIMRAYLMKIPREWYEEDQARKQKDVDMIDEAIRTPGFASDKKGVDRNQLYGRMDYKTLDYKA